ncbi:amidase family protein [Streptomyces sp. SL13]|uniref:Amidase family protein n=1 Tax=Streptantibioticus silvisoli TaxID=2705255 RepID=A0AA90H673_9ACTN|nr:amidase family protein [Streptantibioticus silvisoli]MDI5971941.1 amidase family protein [Streptantibioticus silvisoli]
MATPVPGPVARRSPGPRPRSRECDIDTSPITASAAPPGARDSVPCDLETATVAELSALLDAGTVTAVALTRAYLRRIDALDVRGPALRSVRCLNPDALADAAAADERRAAGETGPMLGIPVLLKDNIDVAGLPTTAGSLALADSRPAGDAPLVTRLRVAGAVLLGKTNLTEFANYLTEGMPSGYSSLAGQVLNPYDLSRTPSGSSSGSGAAAAAGLAAVTVGTETSGSIISPAAANSLVGVKPTVGLVSRTGIVPIAASQDTAGPMARTVADAAALLTVIAGPDPEDPATAANPLDGHDFTADLADGALDGVRLGVVDHEVPAPGSGERVLWDAAMAALTGRGATLVEVALPTRTGYDVESIVLSYEFKRDLNAYLARLPQDAPVRTLAEVIAFNDAHAARTLKFGQKMALAAQQWDVAPDSADSGRYRAARARDLEGSRGRIDPLLAEQGLSALLFVDAEGCDIGAKAGYPSITVPAGYLAAGRAPFNLTFLGPAWSEPVLIGLAHAFEQATRSRRPPSEVNPTVYGPGLPG